MKKPTYEELREDLAETEAIRQRLFDERAELRVTMEKLAKQLHEALHNKAQLEYQLRARLSGAMTVKDPQ